MITDDVLTAHCTDNGVTLGEVDLLATSWAIFSAERIGEFKDKVDWFAGCMKSGNFPAKYSDGLGRAAGS